MYADYLQEDNLNVKAELLLTNSVLFLAISVAVHNLRLCTQSLPYCASEKLVPPVHPAPKPPTPVVPKPSLSPSCTSPLIPATPSPLPKTVVLTTDTTDKEVRT